MEKYKLTTDESVALAGVKTILEGLPTASQYLVLRNLAHDMDREVVRPGATRAAAAVAGATARALADSKGSISSSKGKKKKETVRYSNDFLAKYPDLVRRKEAANKVAKASGDKITDAQKDELRSSSKALRQAWESFRAESLSDQTATSSSQKGEVKESA